MGNTMVLAAVFGPAVGRSRGSDRPEALTIEIVLDRNSGVPFEKIVAFKSIVHDVMDSVVCVEQYPRCTLVVALRCLRDDGGVLSALINAGVAALMDAGVEMRSIPVGCSFALVSSVPGCEPDLLVDPDATEEKLHALVTIVCSDAVVHSVYAIGVMNPLAISRCLESSTSIASTFAQISRRKYSDC